MSNANQMALMVQLANAKNALVSVRTAISCLDEVEYVDLNDYKTSAVFCLRRAEFKLDIEVEYLNKLMQEYVTFIPANKETV